MYCHWCTHLTSIYVQTIQDMQLIPNDLTYTNSFDFSALYKPRRLYGTNLEL
jgi:hypothetical protein